MKTFTKDVARVGAWVDPKTEKVVSLSRKDLEILARNTNAYIAAGHDVWFPDGHTASARADMGSWRNFRLVGDELMADVDVADEAAEEKLGKTIRRVSPDIKPSVLTADGTRLGPTIVHVAATPAPVITGQGDFTAALARLSPDVRWRACCLSRAAGIDDEDYDAAGAAREDTMENENATGAPAPAPAGPPAALAQIASVLGLAPDADEGTLVEAIRQLKTLADTAAAAPAPAPEPDAEMAATLSRERDTLEARVKELEARLEKSRAEAVAHEIEGAMEYCLSRGNLVIEKDTAETVRELFAAGQEKAARHILGLQRKAADEAGASRRGRMTLSRPEADAASAQKEKDDEFMLQRMGVAQPAAPAGRGG